MSGIERFHCNIFHLPISIVIHLPFLKYLYIDMNVGNLLTPQIQAGGLHQFLSIYMFYVRLETYI